MKIRLQAHVDEINKQKKVLHCGHGGGSSRCHKHARVAFSIWNGQEVHLFRCINHASALREQAKQPDCNFEITQDITIKGEQL